MNTATGVKGVFGRFRLAPVSPKAPQSLLRRIIKALESTAIAVGVTASVIAVFVPIDFLRLSSLFHSAAAKTTTSLSQPVVSNPMMGFQKCNAAPAGADPNFSSCASFVLDYSKQANGSVGKTYLNAFVGRSETNNEVQVYTAGPNNLRIENGNLVLEARADTKTNARYTSARVDTKGKAEFMYGKFVVRAKMPTGVGTWPAIWMLSSESKYAKLGPPDDLSHLSDGEIDIAESIGSEPNVVYGVAHTLTYDNDGVDRTFFDTVVVPGNNTSFHDYELDWTPTKLTYKIDGKTFYSYDKPANADYRSWPFDQPFYLIMNLALGGNWAGKDRQHFPVDGVDASALPAALRIQSVRYYSYIAQ